MAVDLPTPGTPVMPTRCALPVCGQQPCSSSCACAACSSLALSISVMARPSMARSPALHAVGVVLDLEPSLPHLGQPCLLSQTCEALEDLRSATSAGLPLFPGPFHRGHFLLAFRAPAAQASPKDAHDPVPTGRRLPARRHHRARPLAAGRRQHGLPAARRLRRRGDQGRGPRQGRSAARLARQGPLAVLEGLRPQQEEPDARPAQATRQGAAAAPSSSARRC